MKTSSKENPRAPRRKKLRLMALLLVVVAVVSVWIYRRGGYDTPSRILREFPLIGNNFRCFFSNVDERVQVLQAFRHRVQEGGPELVEEAVQIILTGGARPRRRAQLILTQVGELTPEQLAALAASPNPEVWAYAMLRTPDSERPFPKPMKSTPPADLEDDPLRDAAAKIKRRLMFSEEELRQFEKDAQHCEVWTYALDIYKQETLPQMDEIWNHIGDGWRRFVDLDRDGCPELLVCSEESWANKSSPFHCAFTALLRQRPGDGKWELAGFERLENGSRFPGLSIMDLNNDGYPEALVRSCDIGAGGVNSYIRVFSRHNMTKPVTINSYYPPPNYLFLQRKADDPILIATTEYICTGSFLDSAMDERVGPGIKWNLLKWNGRRFVKIGEALTPYL